MHREDLPRPLSPLSRGCHPQCLLYKGPLCMAAGTSQELEEVPVSSRGRSAESHKGFWARQQGKHWALGELFLPYGDPQNCEAHPLELLVRRHAAQIRVPHPGPRGVVVESRLGRGCWKARSRKVSPRRRWLLGESVQRRRYSCGQRPRRVTCVG